MDVLMWIKNWEANCILISFTSKWSLQKSGKMDECWLRSQSSRYNMKSEWQGARIMLSNIRGMRVKNTTDKRIIAPTERSMTLRRSST